MLAVLIVLVAVLVLVMGVTLFDAGPSRVRRVVYTPVRRRRRVVTEDVVDPQPPGTTRRVVDYE
ncbi:MAG: hypothetical protein QOI54_1003 [Actinomycetota bacterium]|jgi:hypothetical protein|nr:hypothetical protein [Actinomycetota bacterium]